MDGEPLKSEQSAPGCLCTLGREIERAAQKSGQIDDFVR